ncbi:hypothetical protein JL721_773 [Aureococcus anophagefferens]|nr:hypothetical protein JL721_773 [Aureococcus anophagefferens]
MYGLRVGADMYESNKLTGAIDELYVYTSALDREAISVLYGSVTASPTVTPAPSTYYFEGTLLAYYSFDEGNATDATGAYSGDTYKNEMARNLGPTESRDGGDALGFDGNIHVALPDSLTDSALIGDEERTICLWARIDDWDGGFLFEYGDGGSDGESFGLAVGDAESNVTLALSGSYETVVTIYGNTSYIDWDDWHHYCLTYDDSDVVLYFDGFAEATAAVSLNTIPTFHMKVGADMYASNKLTGAIDELYVYASALDPGAISVLYGSVTASPTVTPGPSTYYFEGTLRAYYSFDEGNATDATGAYSGDTYKNGNARNLGPTESRDGGDALGFDGEVYVVLPDALTYEALTGDEERTICLWARIDDWDGGFLFEYGSDGSLSTGAADEDGKSFGLAVGDAESNVTLALSGSYQTVVTIYGNTSYIDWDDWHHYCLTYDGTGVVLYFDGLAEAAAPASLDTATTYGLRVGADMYGSNMLTGAIDELYGSLLAYYPLDGGNVTDVHGTYSVSSYSGTVVEGRDGGDALLFDGTASSAVELPAALTDAGSAISGADGRTICLWAQVDAWDGGFFFSYGAAQGATILRFGAARGRDITVRVDHNREIQLPASASGDWDDWHHYCLTYDGADVVLYFDGAAAWSKTIAANTGAAVELTLGSRSDADYFTGALDEIYIYTSALDGEAIYVLYSSVTASPTVTPAPSTYYFEGTLLAYYSFDEGNATDATGAYSGDTYKNEMARNLGPTESRDGGDALGFDGNIHTVVTVYGNTSYIDWDDWHHYCLTYDGSDVVLYFDGFAEATAAASLDTATTYGLRVGADMYGSNMLTGAIDELYVYASALDSGAISVLYGSVTASPTVTPAPSTYYFEGSLLAYYPLDGGNVTDVHGTYSVSSYSGTVVEGRDGGDALLFDGTASSAVELPAALTDAGSAITGADPRTICLWAQVDAWDGGFFFSYGAAQGGAHDYFALGAAASEGNVTVRVDRDREVRLPGRSRRRLANASGYWDDWHHYCLAYDGADVALYFDGAAAWSRTIAANTGAAVELTLGSRSGADYFTGALDEVYVYASALDAAGAAALCAVTVAPTTAAPSAAPSTAGPTSAAPTTAVPTPAPSPAPSGTPTTASPTACPSPARLPTDTRPSGTPSELPTPAPSANFVAVAGTLAVASVETAVANGTFAAALAAAGVVGSVSSVGAVAVSRTTALTPRRRSR